MGGWVNDMQMGTKVSIPSAAFRMPLMESMHLL